MPAPTNFFAYIDTQLLYSRLDASLRPMLLLAAAFMPAISSSVDLGKLPSPEAITKHLSPIVSSQRYERDGYVAESVGPITFNQLVLSLAILSGAGAAARQKAQQRFGRGLPSGGTLAVIAKPERDAISNGAPGYYFARSQRPEIRVKKIFWWLRHFGTVLGRQQRKLMRCQNCAIILALWLF